MDSSSSTTRIRAAFIAHIVARPLPAAGPSLTVP